MKTVIDWSKAPDDCLGAVHLKDEFTEGGDDYGIFVTKTKGMMNDKYHYCGHTNVGPQIELHNFTPKPVAVPTFTQKMADAGTLPSVGMMFMGKGYGHNADTEEWFELEALGDYNGQVIAESCSTSNDVHLYSELKPLTPPIELIDGKAYQFGYSGLSRLHGIFCMKTNTICFHSGHPSVSDCTDIKPLTLGVKS